MKLARQFLSVPQTTSLEEFAKKVNTIICRTFQNQLKDHSEIVGISIDKVPSLHSGDDSKWVIVFEVQDPFMGARL